jgi:hypothetical protein
MLAVAVAAVILLVVPQVLLAVKVATEAVVANKRPQAQQILAAAAVVDNQVLGTAALVL